MHEYFRLDKTNGLYRYRIFIIFSPRAISLSCLLLPSQVIANSMVLHPLRPKSIADSISLTRATFPDFTSFPDLYHNLQALSVTFADGADTVRVEEMLRQAAMAGDGFAIDEFTEDGTFNRKFFRRCFVAVLKNAQGDILAAVLFGPSSLCRTEGHEVTGYVIVAPSARRRGLGTAVLKYCLDAAKRLQYRTVLSDVLTSNLKVLGMVQREGFIITATLPNVALVRNTGFVNTYVVWRPLVQPRDISASSKL